MKKKKLLCVVTAVLLMGILSSCGIMNRLGSIASRVRDKLSSEEETEASYDDNDDDEKETEETKVTWAATEEASTETDKAIGSDSTSTDNGWADAYLSYLRNLNDESLDEYNSMENRTFDYIYVDNDDIPELLIQGSDEATGNLILTYHNGVVDALQTSRLYFDYIKKGNQLLNSDGNMGYYYDMVYTIEDGKWVLQFDGQYNVDNNAGEWDEDDLKYYVNDNEISKEEYYSKLAAVYDDGNAHPGAGVLTFDQIKEKLINDSINYENPYLEDDTGIHKYEVIVADATWDEAMEDCKKRGGYLVRINTYEEKSYIEDMLKKNGQEKLIIWLGGCYNPKDAHYHWYDGEKYTMAALDVSSYYNYFWLSGEPSFTGQDAKGNTIDERYMCMFYSAKNYERWFWNDTTYDLSTYYPGRIAYICETE